MDTSFETLAAHNLDLESKRLKLKATEFRAISDNHIKAQI